MDFENIRNNSKKVIHCSIFMVQYGELVIGLETNLHKNELINNYGMVKLERFCSCCQTDDAKKP